MTGWVERLLSTHKDSKEGNPVSSCSSQAPATRSTYPPTCTFHDDEAIRFADAALDVDLHQKWLASGGAEPGYTQCVGYRKPLFLNGADELENLELSDLEIYWHLMGQLIVMTKNLPPGTPVRISIS
jgi:hypothetical protein